MKNRNYTVFFIILGSVLLNCLNAPPFESLFDDREIFRYAGLVIFKGGVPYRDFFDHKPPLIYFFNVLYWINSWIPWLLDTVLIVFASLLFYWLCKAKNAHWPWFPPLIFNLLIRYSLISFGNGMTREYTAVLLLIFFCVMQGNARRKYLILGILTGLSFWMQQDSLITLTPFLLYSIFSKNNDVSESSLQRVTIFSGGFLSVTLPVLLYFFWNHAAAFLWQDAFVFNVHTPGTPIGLTEKLKHIKRALHDTELEMAVYITVVLSIISLMLKPAKRLLLSLALLTVISSFSAEYITGRMAPGTPFVYYLLPLSATIPILLYITFTESHLAFIHDKIAQLTFYIMVSLIIFLGTIRFATGVRLNKTDIFNNVPATAYLNSQHLKDFQLYVFDDSNLIWLYNQNKILSPSPWLYHYFWDWSKSWDLNGNILQSIIADLQTHRTKFILDCSGSRKRTENRSAFKPWNNFLIMTYKPLMQDNDGRILWIIK